MNILDIKALREYLNVSQTEFSEKLGISQPYLSDLERKKRLPTRRLILKIENKYGSSITSKFLEKKQTSFREDSQEGNIESKNEFFHEKISILEEMVETQKDLIDRQKEIIKMQRDLMEELRERLNEELREKLKNAPSAE